jgi:hypothetical protein
MANGEWRVANGDRRVGWSIWGSYRNNSRAVTVVAGHSLIAGFQLVREGRRRKERGGVG